MKSILVSIVAAVFLVGCGQSDHQHSHDDGHSHAEGDHHHAEGDIDDHDKELKAAEPVAEATQPEPPTAKTPDASLWDAAMFGKIEAAKKAIADGANVNAKKDDGETPLHSAVVAALDSGDKEVVELLITNGAGVNAKVVSGRKQGMTPLDAANVVAKFSPLPTTVKNLSDIANLLRKHGGKTGEELKAADK